VPFEWSIPRPAKPGLIPLRDETAKLRDPRRGAR
jgi:hypothetical protein